MVWQKAQIGRKDLQFQPLAFHRLGFSALTRFKKTRDGKKEKELSDSEDSRSLRGGRRRERKGKSSLRNDEKGGGGEENSGKGEKNIRDGGDEYESDDKDDEKF